MIIPVVAIPISLIGAVFLMLVAGFTINLLTLLAIVLSVGLVVDDAIVMVENIERHLHQGQTPLEAALDAARELVGPIIAMTITLAAVYTPIGIQGGLTGALFREFAFTLAGAVIVSGVVALTLSPMMGSRLLRAGDTERGFAGMINRHFERVRQHYTRVLARHARSTGRSCSSLWAIVVAADRALLPVLAEGAGAEGGPGRRLRRSSRRRRTRRSTRPSSSPRRSTTSTSSFPETESIFQITHADAAASPAWSRSPGASASGARAQLQVQAAAQLSKIPGVRVIPLTPAAAARRRRLPGGLRRSRRPPSRSSSLEFANQLVQKAYDERHVHVRRHRPEVRPAAGGGRLRPRQGCARWAST